MRSASEERERDETTRRMIQGTQGMNAVREEKRYPRII